MTLLVAFLLPFFVATSLIPILGKLSFRLGLIDLPDTRKVHERPMPRVGGVCMILGVFIPSIFYFGKDPFIKWFFIALSVIFVSGIIDDSRGLSPLKKLFAQVIASLVIILFGGVRIENLGSLLPEGWTLPPYLSIPVTLITIVGVTNAINLADGLDGLAGGICLFIFACLTYLAYLLESFTVAFLSIAISGAIFGFLHFNTHPATIFMGDTGSQFLGFSAITLSVKLSQSEPVLSPLLPVLLLGFPILDTITVMIQRYKEGRSIFLADKNHFHHKLIRLGFSHSEAVLIIYVIQALLTFSAFTLRFYSEWLILVGYVLFAFLVLALFAMAEKSGFSFEKGGVLERIRVVREWKKTGTVVRISFPFLKIFLLPLFFLSLLLPREIHREISILALAFAIFLVISYFKLRTQMGLFLRISLYLLIPYVIYLGDSNPMDLFRDIKFKIPYDLSFFFAAFLAVLTARFSRRRQGFKATPMDFLIVFFVIVFPKFSLSMGMSDDVGVIAMKIVALFYSFEVLVSELRGEYERLLTFTLVSLVTIFFKGFLPSLL